MSAARIKGWSALVLAGGVITAMVVALPAAPASAALKHYDGTVLGKDRSAKTFRVRTESGKRKFKVTARTEFERIAGGFGALHRGDAVEVDAKRKPSGRLVARQVEPQRSGGDDRRGDDDGGHGADDPSGDDHGGQRSDDPAGDDHGGHHADDPAGDDRGGHGADDPAGDDHGEDGPLHD
jgi:Domain of unknown function (DUF5666)